MHVLADRFLEGLDGGAALDLATNARVDLFVDRSPSRAGVAARTAVCDRLARLRHPLLIPLVDYGLAGRVWFEAYVHAYPAHMSARQRSRAALHVVRFLRAAGVELTAELAARTICTVFDGTAAWEPLGVFLHDRPSLEAVRTLLEGDGPPGTTAIEVVGPEGSGLDTARTYIARLARLAGHTVVDARTHPSAGLDLCGTHLCVLDWLPPLRRLPPLLAAADPTGARRHVWIRFCREPLPAPRGCVDASLRLEPLMRDELVSAIYLDRELGPTIADVRAAAEHSGGWPGPVVLTLSAPFRGRGAGWVHETSPAYGGAGADADRGEPPARGSAAGVARLERAAAAARALIARGRHGRAERLLARCAPALAARGGTEAAAAVACDLGELLLDRGRPAGAAEAFERARQWGTTPATAARALIGTGRALLDRAQLREAEGAFRTAAAAGEDGVARVWLARTLWLAGRHDVARAAVGDACPALLSRILLAAGDLTQAAAAARAAVARECESVDGACEAHVAAAHVHAAMADADGVRRHVREASRLARQVRRPALHLQVEAEGMACLDRCGVSVPAAARARLLRAASRVPPLVAGAIRAALAPPPSPPSRPAAAGKAPDIFHHFQSLVDATHDSGDEAEALQRIAAALLTALDACSAAIRCARTGQIVAAAGRPWPGELARTTPILSGGAPLTHDGVTPEAVEPIAAGGAVVGALALRWIAGANPGWDRVRDILRVTAVATAPLLRAMKPVDRPAEQGFPDDLLGRGEAAERVRGAIRRAAAAPYPVLIEGESGSGKELVARAIHARSLRRARRFCAVNCAALTDDLLEAELFGHARGAFTGAVAERPGLFEEADQGTLFLDEAGELSARAQAKLLRVLQEGEIRRVGENLPRKVDARIVAASNRSLEQEVQAGRFRADLRFRLDVIRIQIPPLRDRPEDLAWLAERTWREAAARVGSRAVLATDVLSALLDYEWPGNVRELQNVMAALAVHGPRRGRVPASLLPARIAHEAGRGVRGFEDARAEFERAYVRTALARAGGNRSIAAEQLRLSRQGLNKTMRRLGLE
jgi:DNA-binding NtrC family response regulator/tetratricopeptide (TPR) repeat protein